jgi:hypothetical protein
MSISLSSSLILQQSTYNTKHPKWRPTHATSNTWGLVVYFRPHAAELQRNFVEEIKPSSHSSLCSVLITNLRRTPKRYLNCKISTPITLASIWKSHIGFPHCHDISNQSVINLIRLPVCAYIVLSWWANNGPCRILYMRRLYISSYKMGNTLTPNALVNFHLIKYSNIRLVYNQICPYYTILFWFPLKSPTSTSVTNDVFKGYL